MSAYLFPCCAAAKSSEDCAWSNASDLSPVSPKQFLNKAPACLSIDGRKAMSSGHARRMEYPASTLRQGPALVDLIELGDLVSQTPNDDLARNVNFQ